ncbi:DUF3179 domain-containing (seleno)protein [Natronomonas sp.]|uniref:DUF3179 domain-containing (seleno)protein n=1 Tax=Natronomonas sp. TaxID=2184060 RepID=UPI002FC31B50
MRRRAYLASAAAALAGCTTGYRGEGPDDAAPGTPAPSPEGEADIVSTGLPVTLCEEAISPGGLRPIVGPAFGQDWSGVDAEDRYGELTDATTVIGLTAGDRARAYPISLVRFHEAVNDELDGPTLVTYCSICRSGMVAERRVDGEATRFAASGLLWRPPGEHTAARIDDDTVFGATDENPDALIRNSGNLVLYDEATESYWSQLLAKAVCGPRTGERLTILPSTVTTWGEWRRDHPGGEVLLPPPASETVARL